MEGRQDRKGEGWEVRRQAGRGGNSEKEGDREKDLSEQGAREGWSESVSG
jgi:hypothetical protein